MATKKKFKLGLGNRAKGGFNNTRTILTSAGVVTLGAAGAAYTIGYRKGKKDASDDPTNKEPEKDEQVNPSVDKEAEVDKELNPQEERQETKPNEGSPTTDNDTAHQNSTPEKQNDIPAVDPDKVAMDIVNEDIIDMEDLDFPTIISIDSLKIKYLSDGQEIIVAEIHTLDGEQYQLADIDGDGFYTDIFDMNGNYVGEAEGNLCYSDLEIMVEESNGYLAISPEPQGDDPTYDIVDTENYHHPEEDTVADNNNQTGQGNSSDYDHLSAEELLALLLADDEEAEATGFVDMDDEELDIPANGEEAGDGEKYGSENDGSEDGIDDGFSNKSEENDDDISSEEDEDNSYEEEDFQSSYDDDDD